MPQIKALWNRHSATFQQHTPLNDDDANTNNNNENPARLKSNSTTNTAPKMPRSPMRRPSPTSVTTSHHHNQQDTRDATAKKRPRTLRIHPNKDGSTHFGPGSAITAPEGTSDTDNSNNKIVFLRRDDLQLGPIIGEGGFAQVYGLFQCPSKLKCADLKGKAQEAIETTRNDNSASTSVSTGGKENGKENSKLNDSVCSYQSTASSVVAKELEDNRQYCVKVIRKGLLQNNTLFQKAADDLVNEAELLAQLGDHPHIIKLRGLPLSGMAATAGSSTKRPLCHPKKYHHFFLLLDQLSETLGDRIEIWKHNDAIQPKQQQQQGVVAGPGLQRPSLVRTKSVAAQFLDIKVSYATQMASALSYLHQRRILFRDLKPENIGFRGTLATGDHTLVMFDFGMARHLPRSSSQANQNSQGNSSIAAKRGHERSHSTGNSNAWMMQAFSGVTSSTTSSSFSPTTVATSISSFGGFGGGGSSRPPKPGDCSASVSSNHSSQSGASSAAGSASSNKSNLENKSPLGKQPRQALPEQRQWPLPQPPPRKEEDEYFRMTVCGTQRYMSNEVLLEGKYSFKSDCYAWAMVVWEIFAHAKPFHYMSPTVHKILVAKQGDRPPLSCYGIAEELQELMELAWAPKVADRITMAEICSRLTKYNQSNTTFASANTSVNNEEPSFSSSLPPSPEKQPQQEQLQQLTFPGPQGSPQKTSHDSSLFSAPRSKGHRKSSSMNLPTAASLLGGDEFFGIKKEASSSGQNRTNLIPAMGNRSHRQPRQNLPPQQHQAPPAPAPRLMRRLIPKMVLRERKDVAAPATVEAPPATVTAPPAAPPTALPVPPAPTAAQPGRILLQHSGTLSFDQQSDNDGSFNNINSPTPGRTGAAHAVNKGLSLQDLQQRKRDLKEQLKQYDIRFAQQHGRMPRKDEKEPIRAVYEHYNALKLHIVHLEKLKRQLKAYDMHFASQHGRMPYKAEKEAIRHLYEKYKTLKVTIGTFVDNFEASRRNNTSMSSLPGGAQTPPRSLFSQWAMGGWNGNGFGSFDSELTPEGIEVAEL